MSRRRTVVTVSAIGAFSMTMLGGCGDLLSRDELIRMQPTPEVDTLYQRSADVNNAWTVMEDENWRMFIQDLGRAFYTDRPSRLTREPVPHP